MKNKTLALMSVCSVMALALLGAGCNLNDARTLGADLANRGLTEADCESAIPMPSEYRGVHSDSYGLGLQSRTIAVSLCREGFRDQQALLSGHSRGADISSSMRGSRLAYSGAPISSCGSEADCRASAVGVTSDEAEIGALVTSCLSMVHECRRGYTAASIVSGRSDATECRSGPGRCL